MNRIDDIGSTLLIVDDELPLRQSYSDYFEDREWQVYTAGSSEAALELLQTQPCCAAIVDIRMSGMNGESFIREAIARYAPMVFVICTGSVEYEPSSDILNEPCVSTKVFSKPVSDIRIIENEIVCLLEKNKAAWI